MPMRQDRRCFDIAASMLGMKADGLALRAKFNL